MAKMFNKYLGTGNAVEHLPDHSKFEGSCPAAAASTKIGRKNGKKIK
jgi:hypothetical protein